MLWRRRDTDQVSVLFNEPKLLKYCTRDAKLRFSTVSVLFNEPKLLKYRWKVHQRIMFARFSALQRAEIAEIDGDALLRDIAAPVSVLFNEPKLLKSIDVP